MVPAPHGVFKPPAAPAARSAVLVPGEVVGDARRPAMARLNVTLAVKRLVRDLAARVPELAHVRASRILVVAGEARRASRATIRPAHYGDTGVRSGSGARRKPLIRVKGRKILYVITLRPLWFLRSTPRERIATIVHELYHASTSFDGTLHRGRRHARLPLARYDRKVQAMVDRYLAVAPAEMTQPFAAHGLVRARMWLERPAASYLDGEYRGRRVYTEAQLFQGVVEMVTRKARAR
ncbi:MAG TPA: putative metallopeptidase [Anaeromyxobacter sp.]